MSAAEASDPTGRFLMLGGMQAYVGSRGFLALHVSDAVSETDLFSAPCLKIHSR